MKSRERRESLWVQIVDVNHYIRIIINLVFTWYRNANTKRIFAKGRQRGSKRKLKLGKRCKQKGKSSNRRQWKKRASLKGTDGFRARRNKRKKLKGKREGWSWEDKKVKGAVRTAKKGWGKPYGQDGRKASHGGWCYTENGASPLTRMKK